ncbi:efflux RND transporter permease subunit [Haliangium ochraceum]|uniref:Acriflavin resistance protein n=1 Tax=Haliangium ochraceum (strain DSM 14365 / JCM 11303 / SMP-2) TaxID=502025 RepID=D0LNZ2_HALO1|nr:efflux RND transporter permease subunit [Haliangium ochraceum]ACY18818.1 acriflavin resistance protein [Haliangium ochraceum DSM 14365]
MHPTDSDTPSQQPTETNTPNFAELDPDRVDYEEEPRGKFGAGALAWMAKNSVAANVLMFVLLIGGAIVSTSLKQEVFPEFDLDIILVNVPYPGASPEEVEKGVGLAVEEAVRGLTGIKQVTTTASEGMATVVVELLRDSNPDQLLNEIKASVDRITSFPEDAEEPTVFMARIQNLVLSLVFYGDLDEKALRAIAERARDQLLQDERVTVVELGGVRDLEISIEVPQENLRRYGLTLEQIAGRVRQASIELPGGGLKTSSGEVLVRTAERRDSGVEFEQIELLSQPDGSTVYLGDVAEVIDGFTESDQETRYNGKRAVLLQIFRVGEQTPIEVSDAAKDYISTHRSALPPGVDVDIWADQSTFYKARRDLLFKNAAIGLVLVLLILGIFLEVHLAFWVTMGIPISFIGALLFLPMTDVSINMISLFAFILVLGMVVDDAIIVGETVYRCREEGLSRMDAAVRGVREVAVPVTFAIITTIIAYVPLLIVPGVMGKFFRVIPMVVIVCLLMSLVESLLILPAHLAHSSSSHSGVFGFVHRQQQRFSQFLTHHIQRFYVPTVTWAVRWRGLTAIIGVAVLAITIAMVATGRVETEFFPSVESDVINVQVEMPFGTAIERTTAVQKQLEATLDQTLDELGNRDTSVVGILSQLGTNGSMQNGPGQNIQAGSHMSEISVFLVPSDERSYQSNEVIRLWRNKLGEVPGVERISFSASTGPGADAPINIELSHIDLDVLYAASSALAGRLSDFAGTFDVNDGFSEGKPQLDLELTAEGRALGLTETDLARQIRAAFFGAEAVRQQRGRDEIRTYVRLPRSERESEYNIEEMIVRTPEGGELPLARAAHISRGRSYTSIRRIDGRRAVSVTADVDDTVSNANKILGEVTAQVLPELLREFPGLTYQFGGDTRDQQDSLGSLMIGLVGAVLAIFALLAIVFRSYLHPIAVITAIPFGFVGAVIGHLLLGFKISLMSAMGIVALAGVVVNDSLILIVAINRFREMGMTLQDAVVAGGAVRFRPIILTSLTTFFGLAPMILETSVQARFLIPMALSLGFGIIFATVITLLLVPAVYMIIESARYYLGNRWVLILLGPLGLPLILFGLSEPERGIEGQDAGSPADDGTGIAPAP